MRAKFRKSTVIATITLIASGICLTGCSPAAGSANGGQSSPKSSPKTQASGPCSAAVAAAFLAHLNAPHGDTTETQDASSSYHGPIALPALTKGMTPSCVFRGDGSQDAIFLGASLATLKQLETTLGAAPGFNKIGSKGNAAGFSSANGVINVGYDPNGAAYSSDVSVLTTPFVWVEDAS